MKKKFYWLNIFLYFALGNLAYAGAPHFTTFQAKILTPSGVPLEAASVDFRFTVMDSAGTCTLYVEDFSNVSMVASGGVASLSLGTGTKSYPVAAVSMYEVFNNSAPSFTCQAGGTISPIATDNRQLIMQFNDGTGWQTLPQMSINSVPYANFATRAENLGNYTASNYLRPATLPTCTAGQALNWDGTSFTCITSGGGSTLTSVTSISNASGDITLSPIATTGSVLVDSNTPSAGTSTGALVVSGGVGVSGNIHSGGNIVSSGSVSGDSGLFATSVYVSQLYGTSTPSGPIKIDGTSNATKGNVLLASTGGNVGIGTTTPTSKLHGVTTLNAATGNEVAYLLDYTTNKATSGNDTGLLIKMTDTASPGTSKPLDIQVGGSSVFSVSNTGVVIGNGSGLTGISASPAGSTGDLQFNSGSGALAAVGGLNWDEGGRELKVAGTGSTDGDIYIWDMTGTTYLNMTTNWSSGSIISSYQFASGYRELGLRSDGLVIKSNAGNETMRVTSTGNVGIGTTTPQTSLQVAGVISPATNNTYTLGNATYRFTEVYATNGMINTSDRREKKDIYTTDLGLDFINRLRPVSYRWNTGVDDDVHYGLIAQETEQAIADVGKIEKTSIVTHDEVTDRYGVRYSELISPLIRAAQELYGRIMGIEARQGTQDQEIATLKVQAETEKVAKEKEMLKLKKEIAAQANEMAELKARLDKIEKALKLKTSEADPKIQLREEH